MSAGEVLKVATLPSPEHYVMVPLRQVLAAERLCGFAQSIPDSDSNGNVRVHKSWRDDLLRIANDYAKASDSQEEKP